MCELCFPFVLSKKEDVGVNVKSNTVLKTAEQVDDQKQ
jgi:hypothetical protein